MNSGQSNQRGINAQNYAALSLFLQHVSRNNFRYIGFESEKLEDFHLVFGDGTKIICESKVWSNELSYPQIKSILGKIIQHKQINPGDEIIIVAEGVKRTIKNEVENVRFYEERIKEKFINEKGYTEKEFGLLKQLNFWEVNSEISEKAIDALLSDLLGIWVPDSRLKEIRNDILIKKVYRKSETGETLSRTDFIKLLDNKKTEIINSSGYYSDKNNAEKEAIEIIENLNNPNSRNFAINQISALSANFQLHHFLLSKLKDIEGYVELEPWGPLWDASVRTRQSHLVFDIFQEQLGEDKNIKYAHEFMLRTAETLPDFYQQKFIRKDMLEVCEKIIETGDHYEKVFDVIKNLFTLDNRKWFYVETKNGASDKWEREETAKLLVQLHQKADHDLRDKIFNYITTTFNLIRDDGEYWSYTPPQIFSILRDYLSSDLSDVLPKLQNILADHFNDFYEDFGGSMEFDGWEHMGSWVSNFGGDFSVSDRHYVDKLLKPALNNFYKKDRDSAWAFIAKNCVTDNQKKVSSSNPDYLNRASIDILMNEYMLKKHSDKAFGILRNFILMTKGIPDKATIIYQSLRDNNQFSSNKKWNLVKVSLDKYNNLPVNVFVEQIITELVKSGHTKALSVIKEWASGDKYQKSSRLRSHNLHDIVANMVEVEEIFKDSVEVINSYINNDYFNTLDSFDAYDTAGVVAKVIEKNSQQGLNLLQDIYNGNEILNGNQQIIICSSLDKIDIKNKDVLIEAYGFIRTILADLLGGDDPSQLESIERVERKFTHRHSRETLVDFAENLAKVNLYKQCWWLLQIFINDSDPPTDGRNYEDDQEGTFNEHQKIIEGKDDPVIRTVRVKVAWALRRYSLLPARKLGLLSPAIDYVERLAKDPNYFVRKHAIIALTEFARNSHTVMPDQNEVKRFMLMQDAEKVKEISFDLLANTDNQKVFGVMKSIVYLFHRLRYLPNEQAMHLLNTLRELPNTELPDDSQSTLREEVLNEAAPLFIFYAEFRKGSFVDNVSKELFEDRWVIIKDFEDSQFKKLLIETMLTSKGEARRSFAWQFWKLAKDTDPSEEDRMFKIAYKYLSMLAKDEYDHSAYSHIYRFIEDHIDSRFEECFSLWATCIKKERKALKELAESDMPVHEYSYWPYYHNGLILIKVLNNKSGEKFLEYLEFLVDYPENVDPGHDLKDAILELENLEDHKEAAERVMKKLIERNINLIDLKPSWMD